eukprot:TRINITY_DN2371_c0_g1_i5.p1 TRINITY_DN2371_c0_g1~~TRINITY_DN2371_c0_g1_i5.p1  ORF type:complete len:438 (+),score=78.22 TRINITY_DN2371_c0_g1_i5:90-1403(+)
MRGIILASIICLAQGQGVAVPRELGEENSFGAWTLTVPCVDVPGGKLFDPCGKMGPNENISSIAVTFGAHLFDVPIAVDFSGMKYEEKKLTVIAAIIFSLLFTLPFIILRFVNKPVFDAIFGNTPRADKDPTASEAELKWMDEQKMQANGDAFIAPVNYYRAVAMFLIANPPDMSPVFWFKLLITTVVVAAVQLGTPIYMLCRQLDHTQVVGLVPLFDLSPSTIPKRMFGLAVTVFIIYKTFTRKIEDAYDANIYIISRQYIPPEDHEDASIPGIAGLAGSQEMVALLEKRSASAIPSAQIQRNNFIRHIFLSFSMAVKMIMCCLVFCIALLKIGTLEFLTVENIVTTATAFYLVADLDKTAVGMDQELKDRYRLYVLRLYYGDASNDQATQDLYTSARTFYNQFLQLISVVVILLLPFIQFQVGEILIPKAELVTS